MWESLGNWLFQWKNPIKFWNYPLPSQNLAHVSQFPRNFEFFILTRVYISFNTSLLHLLRKWLVLSSFSLQILRLLHGWILSIFACIKFTLMACSEVVIINDSVSTSTFTSINYNQCIFYPYILSLLHIFYTDCWKINVMCFFTGSENFGQEMVLLWYQQIQAISIFLWLYLKLFSLEFQLFR